MDKEVFNCSEYIQSSEMEYFPAERYFVKESLNCNCENYNAPEIATTQKKNTKVVDEGMSVEDAQDYMQSSTVSSSSSSSTASSSSSASSSASSASSSASASASSSAAATSAASASAAVTAGATVAASVATICVATIVGAVEIPGLEPDKFVNPPVVIEQPAEEIDYGTFQYDNYVVEYTTSEDSNLVYATVTFNFDGELQEDFSCQIKDTETEEIAEVTAQSVIFSELINKDRTFELTIYKGEKIVESQTINFEDHYLRAEEYDSHYVYKSTLNDDSSFNIYSSFSTSYEGEFVTYINIVANSEDFVEDVKHETIINGKFSSVLNVALNRFSANFVTYYVKDNNYYYYNSQEIFVGDVMFEFDANVVEKKLTLNFANKLNGIVDVYVTHDDSSTEQFSFNSSDIVDNKYEIVLGKFSRNPTVEVFASAMIYNFDPLGEIVDSVGNEYFEGYNMVFVESILNTQITLNYLEIFDSSYNTFYKLEEDLTTVPVNLNFDGYLNPGDSYTIRVYTPELLELGKDPFVTVTELTQLNEDVTITNLLLDQEYVFRYYIVVNGEESLVGEITKSTTPIDKPGDLPSSYCNTPNPGDVLVTYNEDGTSQVYMYMNVAETTYDMYYKVYLVDVTDETKYFLVSGNDNIAVFNNIPVGQYSIRVATMLSMYGANYSVNSIQWPSGSIYVGTNSEGNYSGEAGYAYYDGSTGELSINLYGQVMSGMTISLVLEGEQPKSIAIPADSITSGTGYSSCTVDLSGYLPSLETTFTTYILGEAVFQYGYGDMIKSEQTITGNEYCPFKLEYNYTV